MRQKKVDEKKFRIERPKSLVDIVGRLWLVKVCCAQLNTLAVTIFWENTVLNCTHFKGQNCVLAILWIFYTDYSISWTLHLLISRADSISRVCFTSLFLISFILLLQISLCKRSPEETRSVHGRIRRLTTNKSYKEYCIQ